LFVSDELPHYGTVLGEMFMDYNELLGKYNLLLDENNRLIKENSHLKAQLGERHRCYL
jgi:regulator of replication initiation timing